MINRRLTPITIVTNEPTKIRIENDTLAHTTVHHFVAVERQKNSLEVTAFSNEKNKTVKVKARNSVAYWLNLYPYVLWTGFIIDHNNPKRYSYPKTIYIDLNDPKSRFLPYKPLDSVFAKYDNILKITPLKTVLLDNSGIEISYEKRMTNCFSTQITADYMFPLSVWDINNDFKPQIKGFQLAIEEKYYLRKSAPLGPYVGFEFNYLQNKYRLESSYGDHSTPDSNWYTDTIRISKKTYSFNFKIGYQYIIKRFSIDLYAGLGARYKDVVHYNRIKPEDDPELPESPDFFFNANKEGKYWVISIPLNVRLGLTF